MPRLSARTIGLFGLGLLLIVRVINESNEIAETDSVLRSRFQHNDERVQAEEEYLQATELLLPNSIQQTTLSSSTLRFNQMFPSPTPLLKHLSPAQIIEHFVFHPLELKHIPRLFPKPAVDDNDLIAIYSKSAWNKLRHLFTSSRDRPVTMVVSAGTSMTGAGNVEPHQLCFQIFANMFDNVTVVNRAHGSRISFHTMQLMHSYFPNHTDVVLWEFAINDVAYHLQHHNNNNSVHHHQAYLEQRNQLILYLEQVARLAQERHHEPPLVILLYLWDMPLDISTTDGHIPQSVFDSHRQLAAHYDFVVGHVNAAKYLETWQLGLSSTKTVALHDSFHPNRRGHLILAYLLHDLVMNEQRPVPSRGPLRILNQTNTRPVFTWACGNETVEQRRVRHVLMHRHPIASFTEEVPKNKELLSGMLQPTSPSPFVVQLRSKAEDLRVDRLNCLIFPCCNTANISFDVSQYNPMNGIQVSLSPNFHGTTIYFDGDNVTHHHISARTWNCLLRYSGGNSFLQDWIVLEEEERAKMMVSSISMCNHLPSCGNESESQLALGLMSMAMYGGTRDPHGFTWNVS